MSEHPVNPYRVLVSVKNNRLWRAILVKWPTCASQAEAARLLGTTPGNIGRLLNLQWWPGRSKRGGWSPLAERMATQLHETPEYLFDAALYGRPIKPMVAELDQPARVLADLGVLQIEAAPDELVERDEQRAMIQRSLARLTPVEAAVLRLRFGLDGGGERTMGEVAEELADQYFKGRIVSKTRIQQVENKALRRLHDHRTEVAHAVKDEAPMVVRARKKARRPVTLIDRKGETVTLRPGEVRRLDWARGWKIRSGPPGTWDDVLETLKTVPS